MNKLIFNLERDFNPITLIANNHKDLEDYLNEKYDWYRIEVKKDSVIIRDLDSYEDEVASLKWVKHV